MVAEVKSNGKMWKCVHCPKEFKYNSERFRHELSHTPHFTCGICSKKFSFVSALLRHKKQHERTGSVKCKECQKEFRDELLLKRHIKYAHEGTFICMSCDSLFSSDQALQTHMKKHKPVSERPYKCCYQGCQKSFNFSHHLKHHELTHTNAKQHYCNVCGKGFIQSHHLKTHLKSHNPSQQLNCEYSGCHKKFSTEFARKRHMATAHLTRPDSGISSDSNSCDATLSSKANMICISHGEKFLKQDYEVNSKTCINTPELLNNDEDNVSGSHAIKQTETKTEDDLDIINSDCKIAVGDCVADGACICSQMAKPIEDDYDFTPFERNWTDKSKETKDDKDIEDNYEFSPFNTNSIDTTKNPVINKAIENDGEFTPFEKNSTDEIKDSVVDDVIEEKFELPPFGSNLVGTTKDYLIDKAVEENYKLTPYERKFADTTKDFVNNEAIEEHYDFTPLRLKSISANQSTDDEVAEAGKDSYKKYYQRFDYNNNLSGAIKLDTIEDYKEKVQNSFKISDCEGCECARTCVKNPSKPKSIDLPNTVFRTDGVIKIINTDDIETSVNYEETGKTNSLKFMSFGTCKDVLGNCIMDGKGEQCLCARMMMDDNQAMAQEIDDLTPKPKTEANVML